MRDRADNVVVVCSIENFDPMGVHTGDSITVAPAQTLTDREYQEMRDAAVAIMREIGVDALVIPNGLTSDAFDTPGPLPLRELRRRTEEAGQRLRERLPVYPEDVIGRPELFDPAMRAALPRFHDAAGFARSPEDGEKEAA